MVILRSGKDVPFLGKNIPKRNKKQTHGQLSKQQLSNTSQSSQNLNLSSTSDAMKSSIRNRSQISSCSTTNTTDSEELEVTANLGSEDASMISDSDSEMTMIDDTLEITNYEDSRCMDQSNPYVSHSQAIQQCHGSRASYQCEIINVNASQSTQSNMCGVADLSWF